MTELGPLPQEWQVVPLGNLFQIQQGKALSPKHRIGQNARPFLRTANVNWGRIDTAKLDYMDFSDDEVNRLALEPGDLLVCEGGDIGRTAMWEGQLSLCLYQNHLHRLRSTRSDVEPAFYMYWMQAAWTILDLYRGAANKTTIPNLSRSRLASLPVPFPPLEQQRAISYLLRVIQGAKEATEKVIAAARELKKSLMRHLFTYGPVPLEEVGGVRLKETEIGPVPEHWQVVRVGDVVKPTTNIDPRRFPEKHLKYLDVSSIDNERLCILGHQEFLGKDAPSRARKCIEAKDVIFATVRPYLKRIALIPPEYDGQICSTAFCVLRANERVIVPEYLFSSVSHDRFVNSVSEHQRGSSYPAVTDQDVLRSLIPLPPLPEQLKIVRLLGAVDRKIQVEQVYVQALRALFATLLHQLMTGKVRVKHLPLSETEGVS